MGRENNNLQIWGNKESMNLNPMILTNIQSSTYFKQKLYELKTYHEVIDEIYYRVNHLEPWEKGSRRTQGLTGMCGGVRGVGGGGIVSTAFCLLYKLYTLKLTRKQVIGLITHQDSPYIRGLGFMYIRYTQAPQDLFDWYCEYLDDEEELDVKAGGGMTMSIGLMLRQWLTRLEWFDTLFPRIPVPIQKDIMDALRQQYGNRVDSSSFYDGGPTTKAQKRSPPPEIVEALKEGERKKHRASRSRSRSRSESRIREREDSRGRNRSRSRSPKRRREKEREERHRSRSGSRSRRHRSRSKSHSKTRSKSRSRSRDSSDRRHRRHKHSKRHHHKSHHREREDGSRERRSDEARSSKSSSHRSKDN